MFMKKRHLVDGKMDSVIDLRKEVLTRLSRLTDKDISNLQSHDIAVLSNNMVYLKRGLEGFAEKVQERSLEILRNKENRLEIRDVSNLLCGFYSPTDSAIKQVSVRLRLCVCLL